MSLNIPRQGFCFSNQAALIDLLDNADRYHLLAEFVYPRLLVEYI